MLAHISPPLCRDSSRLTAGYEPRPFASHAHRVICDGLKTRAKRNFFATNSELPTVWRENSPSLPKFVWTSAANRLPPASVIGFEAALIVCVVAVGCTAIMTMFAIRDLGWLS